MVQEAGMEHNDNSEGSTGHYTRQTEIPKIKLLNGHKLSA